MNLSQILAGRLAGFLLHLLYGVKFSDMCPFRAIRRDALQGLGMREETSGWNLEMQMRAARSGLRIWKCQWIIVVEPTEDQRYQAHAAAPSSPARGLSRRCFALPLSANPLRLDVISPEELVNSDGVDRDRDEEKYGFHFPQSARAVAHE